MSMRELKTNLDFDADTVRKNNIELLDCQVELILRSLEFYCYTYQFIYPQGRKKSKTVEENLRISLVNDTYEQIKSQYKPMEMTKNKVENEYEIELKKVA